MGALFSLYTQLFPPESKFNVNQIPDLSGKVVIVTGSNTGIGKETAKVLLQHNAKVYVAARSKDKAIEAIEDLKKQTGKEAIFLKLDLADLPSIKASAHEFLGKESKLDILFNNAGVMIPPVDLLTAQNYDLQFGTNVLGPFYFTKLLIPALLAGVKSSPDGTARIVNTSSSAAYSASNIDFNTLKDTPRRRKMSAWTLYCQSKLGNVFVSNELARRYGTEGIVSTSLNPGAIDTDLKRHISQIFISLTSWIMHPVSKGALTQLYAGTMPEGAELNGKFLIPWARLAKQPAAAEDTKLGMELWDWLEEQVASF
ncbi:hypothetical protein NLJ89_g9504 [Agrocybe chaxingu]|uniref:NAD(P)-binding protein n=1 Tax=Agrocybe chaxingu TaxID=84603 RepID=A0A9W8MRR9_9AGAR|nr:hypothetical protein NLJ89_g9504 [Agrocybe chaxingu]